ncbi:hypothetical protein ACLESO_39295 [Pyxidicoccus sp. 3LG]
MSNLRWGAIPLLLCTTWVGCSDPEPTPTPEPDTSVRVKRTLRNLTASGFTERPEDFTRNPVELFLEQGDALVPVTGAAGGPGEYVFPDVPDATYYVRFGTSYVVTTARSVDLGVNLLGRPDAPELETDSPVQLALSGLEPWYEASGPFGAENPSDEFLFVSEERGYAANMSPMTLSGGETSVNEGEVLMFGLTGMMPRFEAERGDRAWVVQLSSRELGTLPGGRVQRYATATRALHLPPFSHDGTGPLSLEGALQPLSQAELALDWKVSDFAAHAAEVHPRATLNSSTFSLYPSAYGTSEGWIGYSGELLHLGRPRGEPSDFTGRLAYGNPFPSSWGLVAQVNHSFVVELTIPDEPPVRVTANISVSNLPSRLLAGPVRPSLLPPRDLTLDGAEGYSSRAFAAGAHVVGWKPPSTGTPEAYTVSLRRLEDLGGFRIAIPTAQFYLEAGATSVRLPAGLLQPGEHYVVLVRAVEVEGHSASGKPFTLGESIDYSSAATLSGLLSIPAE